MTLENNHQYDLYTQLKRFLPLGPEWNNGDSRRVHDFEPMNYEVENPKNWLAEIHTQLHFLERKQYPDAEFALLVTAFSYEKYTILPVRRKR